MTRTGFSSAALALATTMAATGCNAHPIKEVHTDTAAVCGQSVQIPVVKPRVMLVVDRSGSMSENPLGDDTRWSALHGVISSVVTGHQAQTEFGLAMFPAGEAGDTFPTGACSVAADLDVRPTLDNADAILASMPPADAATHGGTPAAAAVGLAADDLRGMNGDDPRIMILVTDGAANCAEGSDAFTSLAYDPELQNAVAQAQLDGITTYVVGIQISRDMDTTSGVIPAEQLNEVAVLGGAPLDGADQFYSVENQAMLEQALDEITADLGCTLPLDETVDPERQALLHVADVERNFVDSCDADGWRYTETEDGGVALQLCGQACSDFQATGDVQLDYLCGQ